MCSEKRCSGLPTKKEQKGISTPVEQEDVSKEKEVTAAELLSMVASQLLIPRQEQRGRSHSCVARFVDDDRFPRLVHIVVHAKVGCHAVQQHAMIGGHLRELLVLVTGGEAKRKK